MAWKINYTTVAEKQLKKLDKSVQRAALKYLNECANLKDPTTRGHGLTAQYAGYHRYRIGQLRIIVKFEHGALIITVFKFGRRDDIYI